MAPAPLKSSTENPGGVLAAIARPPVGVIPSDGPVLSSSMLSTGAPGAGVPVTWGADPGPARASPAAGSTAKPGGGGGGGGGGGDGAPMAVSPLRSSSEKPGGAGGGV